MGKLYRKSERKQRDSNIELLRILAIMGVIVLHYNNPTIGGGFTYSNGINNLVLYWLESIAACAVDLFMLISGYFMVKSERRCLWKIIELVTQVIIFQVAIYLLGVILGNEFSVIGLVGRFLPTNYFVILYAVVFVVSPFIGFVMNRLTKKTLKIMMVLLVLLFSLWPTIVDFVASVLGYSFTGLNPLGAFGDGAGYTFVNFLLCWTVGGYLRIRDLKILKRKGLFGIVGLTAFICLYAKVMHSAGAELEYAFSYCSPLIILEAVLIFLTFKQIQLGQHKVINVLAEGAFAVYLLRGVFLTHIGIQYFVQKNVMVMLLHVIGSSAVIYLICWCVNFIYEIVMHPFWALLHKRIELVEIGILEDEA